MLHFLFIMYIFYLISRTSLLYIVVFSRRVISLSSILIQIITKSDNIVRHFRSHYIGVFTCHFDHRKSPRRYGITLRVFMCIIFRVRAYTEDAILRTGNQRGTDLNNLVPLRCLRARETIINSHLCARFNVRGHRFKKAIINYPKTWTCPVWRKS